MDLIPQSDEVVFRIEKYGLSQPALLSFSHWHGKWWHCLPYLFFIDVVVLVFESDSSVLFVMPVIIPSDFWAEEEFFFFSRVLFFFGNGRNNRLLEETDVAGIIIALPWQSVLARLCGL